MTRAELDAAIDRLIDAERTYANVCYDTSRAGDVLTARREQQDARADLDSLLEVLDFELAFTP